MNVWANAVITTKGLSLQAKLTQGHTLTITRATAGTGYINPVLLAQQTDVIGQMQNLALQPASYPEEGKCAMQVVLTNDEILTGYTARQVGIYAEDPDDGEILYFIAQSANELSGTVVPSTYEMPGFSSEWTFYFKYGQADNVTVMVEPTGFVSHDAMKAFFESNHVAITTKEIDAAFE